MSGDIKMKFIEIFASDYPDNKLIPFQYESHRFYDVKITKKEHQEGWIFDWSLKKMEPVFKKSVEEPLFQNYKENGRYFLIKNEVEQEIGAFAFGLQTWNNITRIYDIYINKSYQRQGIGTQVFEWIENQARIMKSTSLILECQNTNFPAISFYLEIGFELIGFDLTGYSDKKSDPRERRLEMAKNLK